MTKVDYYPFLHLQKDVLETSLHNLTKRWSNWFLSLSSTHRHTCTQKEKGREGNSLRIEIIFFKKHWVPHLQLGMCPAAESWLLILEEGTGENLTCWQVSPELWGVYMKRYSRLPLLKKTEDGAVWRKLEQRTRREGCRGSNLHFLSFPLGQEKVAEGSQARGIFKRIPVERAGHRVEDTTECTSMKQERRKLQRTEPEEASCERIAEWTSTEGLPREFTSASAEK